MRQELREYGKIWLLCVGAAVLYGILHDQVTARIAVEYFTIGHPPVVATDSPTLLALVWGVLATWWVGAIGGVVLSIAARAGAPPRRSAATLVKPLLVLLLSIGCLALFFGWIGHDLAKVEYIVLVEPYASAVPAARHTDYLTVGWAHTAAYGAAVLGGIVVCIRVWWGRRRERATGAVA